MTSSSAIAEHPEAVHRSLFVDSTDLLGDPAALKERAAAEGYLFFKRFLPAEPLRALRTELLAVARKYGWLQQNQDALSGRIDLEAINRVPDAEMRLDIGVSEAAYNEVQKLERLHALPHHPKLIALYRSLFGREILVHPRHVARMVTGHRAMVPTPPHQDYPHIQGTTETWTCWFPVGDCPRTSGALTVLKGSNQQGYIPVMRAAGAGEIAVQLCPGIVEWVEGDFELGDILTFPTFTVHKALRCTDKESIRLSLDVRYQPADQPVEQGSLLPHCRLSWAEIYEDWKKEDLQCYWVEQPLQIVRWDNKYLQPGRRIC